MTWNMDDNWDKNENEKAEPIAGQLSFFSADKSSFLKSWQEKIKFNSSATFEDIIFKNPAFTVQDMERYHYLSEEMD